MSMKRYDRKKIGKDGMFEESVSIGHILLCQFQKNCRYLPIPMLINQHIPI